VIMVVTLLNAMLGFYQEHRAEQSLEALKKMLPLHAQVRREGSTVEVPAEDLIRVPEGTRLFTMPGSRPIAWDGRRRGFRPLQRVRIGRRSVTCATVAATSCVLVAHML